MEYFFLPFRLFQIGSVKPRCCACAFCLPSFGFPPLTLDRLELAHTQRLLLVFMFTQTCRPASSVSPVGYLALSLSTLSLSSQDRTPQVTQIQSFYCPCVMECLIVIHMASVMAKRPFERKVVADSIVWKLRLMFCVCMLCAHACVVFHSREDHLHRNKCSASDGTTWLGGSGQEVHLRFLSATGQRALPR